MQNSRLILILVYCIIQKPPKEKTGFREGVMVVTQIKTSIFNGYRILEKTQLMGIEAAIDLLKTDKQREVSSARRVENDTKAILTSHVLVCPYCNREIPAYAGYVNEPLKTKFPIDDVRPKEDIDEWGAIQLSFYNPSSTILLNRVCRPTGVYKCPHCLEISRADERERAVVILGTETKLQITCQVLGFSEILENAWYLSGCPEIKLPAYESLVFDVENGKAYIELFTDDATKPLVTCDVSEVPQNLKRSVANRVIKSNKRLAEAFKSEFEKVTKSKIPYFSHELDLEKYVLMTRFVGYGRSFYDGIPFDSVNVYAVEDSFKQREKELHFAQDAIKTLETAEFPNTKSVRKTFFEEQGLLFYIEECEMLWDIFCDVNHFCKILGSRRIYEVLCGLHNRPMIAEVLKEKNALHGPSHLMKALTDWMVVENYVVRFLSLSDYAKEKERSRWKGKMDDFYEGDDKYSHPICAINPEIKNCEIKGYRFFWLRNTNDYNRCGTALSNCLTSWSSGLNPVVCVEYEGRLHAAIEVSPRGITQVRGKDNKMLGDDEKFQEAYGLWRKRYSLEEHLEDYDDDFDILPF